MPNGFTGSEEEWIKIESPLKEIDDILQKFACEKDLAFSRI